MTDLAAENVGNPRAAPPRLVRMRAFGVGKHSTVWISVTTAALLLALWRAASFAHLAPHLFLPTPSEFHAAALSIYQDGYANATLWEHVSASLARISLARVIAIGLGVQIDSLMGLSR